MVARAENEIELYFNTTESEEDLRYIQSYIHTKCIFDRMCNRSNLESHFTALFIFVYKFLLEDFILPSLSYRCFMFVL